MTNKTTIVISGAASGIGFDTALSLAKKGFVLVALCKTATRAESTRKRLINLTGNPEVHCYSADFRSLKEVKSVAQQILSNHHTIDVIVNNAATLSSKYETTTEGFECQFVVNYLSHFVLTEWLLPNMNNQPNSKVINVSSRSHHLGTINWENLNLKDCYHPSTAYNQSKLALVLHAFELAERLKNQNTKAYAIYPGFVRTEFGYKNTPTWYKLFWSLISQFGKNPKIGAESILYLISKTNEELPTGNYFGENKPQNAATLASDKNAQHYLKMKSIALSSDFLPPSIFLDH
jgi:NAD(P)-dependent dehydrogenase (short-subunit alcohol dehydrogenase family)